MPLHHHPISTLRMASTRVYAVWGYDYEHNGKSVSFAAGEKFDLVEKSNTDWWLVSRIPGEKFFVPANYLKEESTDPNSSQTPPSPKKQPKPMSPKPVPKLKQQTNTNSGDDVDRLKVKPVPPSANRRNTNLKNRFEELPALPVIPDVRTRDKKPFGSGVTFSYPLNSDDSNAKRNKHKVQVQNLEFPVALDPKRSSCHERILETPDNMYDRLDQVYETVSEVFVLQSGSLVMSHEGAKMCP